MQSERFPEVEAKKSITARWTNILKTYLEGAGYRNPAKPRVLDAGCGEFGNVGALVKYFGKDSEIIGVDRDPAQASLARKRVKKYPNVSILNPERITSLGTYDNYRDYFDVVITRQPLVENCPDNWGGNYRTLDCMLKYGGYLLATFRQDEEMKIAKRMIRSSWLKEKSSARNEFAISIPEKDAIKDRATETDMYVLVAMRATLPALQVFLPAQIS